MALIDAHRPAAASHRDQVMNLREAVFLRQRLSGLGSSFRDVKQNEQLLLENTVCFAAWRAAFTAFLHRKLHNPASFV